MTEHQFYNFNKEVPLQCQGSKKRDRTRLSIQEATCRLLDQSSLASLKVSDICQEADIAHGTFYLYFPDRQSLVADLLLQFVSYMHTIMKEASVSTTTDSIQATTAAYYDIFEQNPGMMKCLMNHLEDFSASKQAFQNFNREWAMIVLDATNRRYALFGDGDEVSQEELLRRVYALGGMVDQYLKALFLDQDENIARISHDRQAVINTLTHIWKRGMFE